MKRILAVSLVAFFALSCAPVAPRTNENETKQVSDQQDIYNKNQPIHTYQFSAERAALIQLYDLRVRGDLNTWSVVVSNSGVPLFSCPSKGFPMPYGTELTNPYQIDAQRRNVRGYDFTYSGVVGQMDPNGVYPTNTAMGTWLLCLDAKGNIHPQYAEPLVMAFTYPVEIKDGRIVVSGDATATLDVRPPAATPTPPPQPSATK